MPLEDIQDQRKQTFALDAIQVLCLGTSLFSPWWAMTHNFLPQTQRAFLRNSYIWLRTRQREGILSALLLYSDRSRKICQREGGCHPAILGPNLLLSWILPSLGRGSPRTPAPAPARQARCSSSDPSRPISPAQLAGARQWGAL